MIGLESELLETVNANVKEFLSQFEGCWKDRVRLGYKDINYRDLEDFKHTKTPPEHMQNVTNRGNTI